MIKAEFGIIKKLDHSKDYSSYEPERYNCIAVNDEYITDWWEQLVTMKTYFHCMDRPNFALARWGVTIIPPESLPTLLNIVLSDKRFGTDDNLVDLARKIQEAIQLKEYMIHFGV